MKKIDNEFFLKRVYETHGDKITVKSEYVNRRTKISVECQCGYEWKTNPYSLTKGSGCPSCKGVRKISEEEFIKILESISGEYLLLSKYESKGKKVIFQHSKCNHTFEMLPKSFLNGQRCPKCRYKKVAIKNTMKFNVFMDKMEANVPNEIKYISGYTKATAPCLFFHSECGEYFEQYPTRIINLEVGCPKCKISKGEYYIKRLLKELALDFEQEKRFQECRNERTLPFDFLVKTKDGYNFLIEYDGIQHFQPKFGEDNLKKTKINDKIKSDFCKKQKIPLIRIPYFNSKDKNKIVNYLYEFINPISTNPCQYRAKLLGN